MIPSLFVNQPLDTGGAVAYTMAADTVSFVLTGNATGLLYGRTVSAATGAFVLTGNAAGMSKGYGFPAVTAAFVLTGNAAGLTAQKKIAAATAAFVLTGNAVNMTKGLGFQATTASFALTGNSANLTAQRLMSAARGIFVLTGNPATLTPSSVPVVPDAYGGGGKRKRLKSYWDQPKWQEEAEEVVEAALAEVAAPVSIPALTQMVLAAPSIVAPPPRISEAERAALLRSVTHQILSDIRRLDAEETEFMLMH